MKIFLAGASGTIGRRLTPLLRSAGHIIVGTTRSADKIGALRALGAEPVMVDVFDTDELTRVIRAAAPQVMICRSRLARHNMRKASNAMRVCALTERAMWWPQPRPPAYGV
jgi:uncharacterized protein YbjT (DUF2867 family)